MMGKYVSDMEETVSTHTDSLGTPLGESRVASFSLKHTSIGPHAKTRYFFDSLWSFENDDYSIF